MRPEAAIERKVVALCKQHGVLCYKFVSPGHAGVPDRVLVFPNGLVAFVELKAPGGRVSALQHHEIERLRSHNVIAIVARSFEEFETWFTPLVSCP